MLTIALIDRHPVARVGLSYLLQENFEEINLLESESADAFQESFPGTKPDLVIMAFANATSSGNMNAINYIASRNRSGMIIVLDEDPDPAHVVSYLRANVKGYLSKQNNMGEIVECIKLVLDGKRYVGLDLMEKVMESFGAKTTQVSEHPSLTYRQYEIATCLAEGMPVASIAKKLGKNVGAINTAKYTIYRKLKVTDLSNLRKLVRTVVLKK